MAEANRGWFGLILAVGAFTALPGQARAQDTAFTRDTMATGQAPLDTAAPGQTLEDTATTGQTQRDTAGQDTTVWGYPTDTNPDVQNPPGYRGMERPTNVFPPDSARDTTGEQVEGAATGTYSDSAWDDTTGAQQNPPGYRGMERPAGLDTADTGGAGVPARIDTVEVGRAEAGDTSSPSGTDTTRVGETTPRVAEDSVRRLPANRGDTTGQSRAAGADTTGQ